MSFCVAKYFIILSPLTTICIFHNSLYYVKTKLKSGGVSFFNIEKKMWSEQSIFKVMRNKYNKYEK
jgi:hypothetical protein